MLLNITSKLAFCTKVTTVPKTRSEQLLADHSTASPAAAKALPPHATSTYDTDASPRSARAARTGLNAPAHSKHIGEEPRTPAGCIQATRWARCG